MYPMYSYTEEPPLHEDDVKGIQHLYGEVLGQGWREEREGQRMGTGGASWDLSIYLQGSLGQAGLMAEGSVL